MLGKAMASCLSFPYQTATENLEKQHPHLLTAIKSQPVWLSGK